MRPLDHFSFEDVTVLPRICVSNLECEWFPV